MPKRVFWPLALIVLGLLFMCGNMGLVPREFWGLWPLLLIIVGLGGWLTSDREDWMYEKKSRPSSKKSTSKRRK